MDRGLVIFLGAAAGLVLLGLLGAAFGAITGAVARRNGTRPGTPVGAAVLRAFTRVADRPPTPGWAGAIVGGADGFVFLGGVGLALGLAAGCSDRLSLQAVAVVFLAAVLLAGGALFFGVMAYGLIAARVRAVGGIALGCLVGAVGGFFLAREGGILLGVLAGAVVGVIVATLTRARGQLPADDRDDDRPAGPPDDGFQVRPAWDRFQDREEPGP